MAKFHYDSTALAPLEQRFLLDSGEVVGAFKILGEDDQDTLQIDLISDEAIKTSEIEGEILNRDSVQSSLRHQFGLGADKPDIAPAERGIAQMMVDLYEQLLHAPHDKTLFLASHADERQTSIRTVGGYRTHEDAMQVVSGPSYKPTVHFEAPPSKCVPNEMRRFMGWFNDTAPKETPLCRLSPAPASPTFTLSASTRSKTAMAVSAAPSPKKAWHKISAIRAS